MIKLRTAFDVIGLNNFFVAIAILLATSNSAFSTTLVRVNVDVLDDFNVLRTLRAAEVQAFLDMNEGLVIFDRSGSTVAGVAEKWVVSDDGKRAVFNLRKNAKWSDGSSITAQDFVNAGTCQPHIDSLFFS